MMSYTHTHLQLQLSIQHQMTLLPPPDHNSQTLLMTTSKSNIQDILKLKCHTYFSAYVFLNHLTCVKLCYHVIRFSSFWVFFSFFQYATGKVFECCTPDNICSKTLGVLLDDFAYYNDLGECKCHILEELTVQLAQAGRKGSPTPRNCWLLAVITPLLFPILLSHFILFFNQTHQR